MPLFLFIVALLFLVSAVRGEEATKRLVETIKADFTGPNNFLVWALALGGLAGLGYVKQARTFSNVFLALVFVVLILTKGRDGKDFISSFVSQIRSTERA